MIGMSITTYTKRTTDPRAQLEELFEWEHGSSNYSDPDTKRLCQTVIDLTATVYLLAADLEQLKEEVAALRGERP